MTTHVSCYESLSSRAPASGMLRPDQGFTDRQSAIPIIAGATNRYLVPPPLVPPSGYLSVPVGVAHAIQFGASDLLTIAFGDDNFVDQSAVVDNLQPFIALNVHADTGQNSGRIAPQIQIVYDGAAEPTTPTTLNLVLQYAHKTEVYAGQAHFCEFEEWPPDTQSDGQSRLASLLEGFNTATNTYLL